MELDNFVRAMMRRWYIPVLLVALAVFGVWTYHKYTDVTTATATVVVLTSTPAPGEFAPPQFGFDAIDESSQLAERVAARLNDGTTANQLTGKISVSLLVDPNQRSAAPVYTVSAKDVDGNRAILIANLAAEEAKKLYGELNQFDGADVRAAFQNEVDRAQADVTTARADLATFLSQNDAYALPARTAQQLTLVSQLELANVNSAALLDALTSARSELDRLTSLDPEYQRLNQAVTDAENTEISLQRQILSIVTGQTLPAQAQVKIFHSAEIQSNLFFAVLTYALGVTLAVLLAISIIYLYAQFERLPPSIRELEQTFNLPVTTQVPHHSA